MMMMMMMMTIGRFESLLNTVIELRCRDPVQAAQFHLTLIQLVAASELQSEAVVRQSPLLVPPLADDPRLHTSPLLHAGGVRESRFRIFPCMEQHRSLSIQRIHSPHQLALHRISRNL